MADVAQSLLAAQGRVVWFTHCEEVRGQVSSYYLACVDKNIHSKETKGVDPCQEEEETVSRSSNNASKDANFNLLK